MKKLNLHDVQLELLNQNLKVFSLSDLRVIFGVEERAAQGFITYNVKKGAFVRLKAGLFAMVNNLPQDFVIANKLYFPSYISLESALSYYNLIPETVYTITSVTTKATREYDINSRQYSYRKIKLKAFTGYVPKIIRGETIYIATPEKAIADLLYFVSLGKGKFNDRLKIEKVNSDLLKNYQKLFKK